MRMGLGAALQQTAAPMSQLPLDAMECSALCRTSGTAAAAARD
jgi:hypothetical protein